MRLRQNLARILTVSLAAAGLAVAAAPAQAEELASDIRPSWESPFTIIDLSDNLQCRAYRQVRERTWWGGSTTEDLSWFNNPWGMSGCSTAVAVPDAPGGASLFPTPYTHEGNHEMTKPNVSGSGTAEDPYLAVVYYESAIASADGTAASFMDLEQRLTYVDGADHYSTTTTVINNDSVAHDITLYQVGQCSAEHQGENVMRTAAGTGAIECRRHHAAGSTGISWIPKTPGSSYLGGTLEVAKAAIDEQRGFGNQLTAVEDEYGFWQGHETMGLSWQGSIPAGERKTYSFDTKVLAQESIPVARLEINDGQPLEFEWAGESKEVDIYGWDKDGQALGRVAVDSISGQGVDCYSAWTDEEFFEPVSTGQCTGTKVGTVTATAKVGSYTQDFDVVVKNPARYWEVVLVDGGNQKAEVGTTFAKPLTFKVQDPYGNPIADKSVQVELSDGATFEDDTVEGGHPMDWPYSDAEGLAVTQAINAGDTPKTITATITPLYGSMTEPFTTTLTVTGPPSADLKTSLWAPSAVKIGEEFTVKITVKNYGPDTSIKQSTKLGFHLAGATVIDAGGGTVSGTSVNFTNPQLASGESVTYTLKFRADPKKYTSKRMFYTITKAETSDPVIRNNRAMRTMKDAA